MRYFLKSIQTLSFWRYALFSWDALTKIFTVVGALYAFLEMLDFFGLYTKDKYSGYAIIPIIIFAVLCVMINRRPITRISYKVPNKDYRIDVRIGDIFDGDSDVVVSTNTTFDTAISNGLISVDSLQGQVATRFFKANTDDIDRQLEVELAKIEASQRNDAPGKKLEYPIGTVARVRAHGRTFYFVAMSRLNVGGTAGSTQREVEDALDYTWAFILNNGELNDLAVPLMGTGRGRTGFPKKKMVERIAQSFADGSKSGVFSNRLSIVIRPQDAEDFGVNLYQIRDYLVQSLHP